MISLLQTNPRLTPVPTGEPAPWFYCRTAANPRFSFESMGGRYIVLSFFGSAAEPLAARALVQALEFRKRFNDRDCCFFGVSVDPDDERLSRVADSIPGVRMFWDFDRAVSARYGAIDADGASRMVTYVVDPMLRVMAVIPLDASPEDHSGKLRQVLDSLPPIPRASPAHQQAPVLVVPRIFEVELCRELMDHYLAQGGQDSGFMRDVNGKTVEIHDHSHKRRQDCTITDETLRKTCMTRVHDRLLPEIERVFQFRATRMERYLIARYDAENGGHFNRHRDNTTRGTAHRRFAISLFLNSGEYEGGELRFPEFGRSLYSAPTGGAVVFSCSMLHEATRVTRGQRYMFLPFLYDEKARRIRDQNMEFVELPRAEGE